MLSAGDPRETKALAVGGLLGLGLAILLLPLFGPQVVVGLITVPPPPPTPGCPPCGR